MERIRKEYEEHKQTLILAMTAVFCWGLLAHGYCFFDYSFSHDALNELHGTIFGNEWKIALGRVFVPTYRDMTRGDLTLPWLIGMLSLFWIGLSVFLTVRILNIQSKALVILTAGIFTANITVSATAATYLHDLDCYMFSLLCAVAAAYFWKSGRWGILPGAVLVTISLGMYQGFLSVTIALIMFVCIFQLLDEIPFKTVFCRGVLAVMMILIGGILYMLAMKSIQKTTGILMVTDTSNSLEKMSKLQIDLLPELVRKTYVDWYERLINAVNEYPRILVKSTLMVMAVLGTATFLVGLGNKKVGIGEKILCLVLVALLPLGLNVIYILTQGRVHDLMVYAVWLTYLFGLLLCQWLSKWLEQSALFSKYNFHRWIIGSVAFLVALVFYGNVQFANGLYLKKDLEQSAYMSYMTRVVGRIEAYEGYQTGKTKVFFAGTPENLYEMPNGFKPFVTTTGMKTSDLLYVNVMERYERLFDFLLGVPIELVDEATWNLLKKNEAIATMSSFPDKGCMKMFDDILVVKLGNDDMP